MTPCDSKSDKYLNLLYFFILTDYIDDKGTEKKSQMAKYCCTAVVVVLQEIFLF